MVAHVDIESNGFSSSKDSLLSVCVLKGDEKYERFYYPVEDYSKSAIKVNGLTEEVVEKKRGDCTYPNHFKDDHADLVEFLSDAETFCAFNVDFDYKWMPQEFKDRDIDRVCTMRACKDDVDARNVKGHKKNPNLREAMMYHWDEIRGEIGMPDVPGEDFMEKVASEFMHDAEFDTIVSRALYGIYFEQE